MRRAAAFQAWYEHLPLRRAQMPRGPGADFQVLDKVSVADGRLSTRRSFVVESGKSSLVDA
jgi:phosphodiesterase/alkaline phosphatase D-like protein